MHEKWHRGSSPSDEEAKKTRPRHPRAKVREVNKRWDGRGTHDCAFLEPLAFPPDLPPVILMDLELG